MRRFPVIPVLAIVLALTALLVLSLLSICGSSQPRNCWQAPARYGGWICTGEGEDQRSYVNPGSGEYEAE